MDSFLRHSAIQLKNIKAVMVDLSGTLHIGSKPMPGAVEALHELRQSPLYLRFVTNTTKEGRLNLIARLTSMGFDIALDEIFTSLTAARDLVVREKLRPKLFLEEASMPDFVDVPDLIIPATLEEANAIVIGLAPDMFNYTDLNAVFRRIMDKDLEPCRLIAIHKSRYYKTESGLDLGPGPFVSALEYATDQKATVVGKPEGDFFNSALGSLTEEILKPHEIIVIGDDVRDDIAGAQAAGMAGCLVKTGKYREGDENKIDPPPIMVADNFAEAVQRILAETNQSL